LSTSDRLLHYSSSPYIYPLTRHDALPICRSPMLSVTPSRCAIASITPMPMMMPTVESTTSNDRAAEVSGNPAIASSAAPTTEDRSEEHTSELQSRSDLVCRLLLEKITPAQ